MEDVADHVSDVFAFDLGFRSKDEPVAEDREGNRLYVFMCEEVTSL